MRKKRQNEEKYKRGRKERGPTRRGGANKRGNLWQKGDLADKEEEACGRGKCTLRELETAGAQLNTPFGSRRH